MDNIKNIYEEILNIVSKNNDDIVFNYEELKRKSDCHLFGIDLVESYGLNIDSKEVHSLDYISFGGYRSVGRWGSKYSRTISWEDSGNQPSSDGEYLVVFCFSTGAYMFGDEYPEELFKEFWQELKSYGPKYTDTVNKALYFSLGNSKDVFNNFPDILKKYKERAAIENKKIKIEKLQKQIELLGTV